MGYVMETRNLKAVYTITEGGEKSYWHRIGVGYINRDGSINIKLHAVPVNGTMHVRDYPPRDEAPGPEPRRSAGNGGSGTSRQNSQQPMDAMPGGF